MPAHPKSWPRLKGGAMAHALFEPALPDSSELDDGHGEGIKG